MSAHGNVILSFSDVTFEYKENKPVMHEVNFAIRENSKITIMGQNGAGKSTLFKLILGELTPKSGRINIRDNASIAIAKQTMNKQYFDLTVEEYFKTAFEEAPYNLPKLIEDVLAPFYFSVPLDKKIKDLSGGQQARLLLAHALIQDPDILLLDEPTNNLDEEGIGFLTAFLMMYEKTVIVVSHEADFLNAFSDGVLYLDVQRQVVDQFVGNYYDVVEQVQSKIEKEQRKNAQLRKSIQDKKDKVNFFANKGGKMRKLASKLREEIEEEESSMVRVQSEDKTIKPFTIPAQHFTKPIVTINSVSAMNGLTPVSREVNIELRKGQKLLIKGPNGIGKSTLLKRLAHQDMDGAIITEGVKIGYYRQDFSSLDFSQTGFDSLDEVMEEGDQETIYATAARFLIPGNLLHNQIGTMSEGQKALLSFARFVLMEPGLLIMDEPTNHVNFRHLPVIAKALHDYEGAMIVVSHMESFIEEIEFTQELDLSWVRKTAS
jgi:ATP-binding cassette subfamily F protein 3